MKLLRSALLLPVCALCSCEALLPPARDNPEGRRQPQSDRVYLERLDREMKDEGR